MNEQLQESLAVLIEKSVQGVEAGAAFLSAELPDVVHQLLMWKLVDAAFDVFICTAIISAFVFCASRLPKHARAYSERNHDVREETDLSLRRKAMIKRDESETVGMIYISASIGLGAASIFAAYFLIKKVSVALQILIAPKIYLIEYAASLVK